MEQERIRLSSKELRQALQEQLKLLKKSCVQFDHGDVLEAKQIAVRLRILWHNTRHSTSLASQLNLADEVFDSSFVVPPTFTSSVPTPPSEERRLFAIGGNRGYAPLFDHGPAGIRKSPFSQWWEGAVISDGKGHKFTRKDLVLTVANTDGGAHVDPALDPAYYALTRNETFGIIRVVPTEDPKVFKRVSTPSPVAVTLRQIGHETLKTLLSDYGYDGHHFYPGPAMCWMSAHIDTGE